MIVPMKKLTLVCLADDRDRTLGALRDLGVVHLTTAGTGPDVEAGQGRLERARSALQILTAAGKAGRGAAEPSDLPPPDRLAEDVHAAVAARRGLSERMDALVAERSAVEPLGEFDPAQARRLGERGVRVRLFHWAGKDVPEPPAGGWLRVLRADGSGAVVALVGEGEWVPAARELPLPRRRLSDILREMESVGSELQVAGERLATLASARAALERHVESLAESLAYARARAGMRDARRVVYLQGFCPADALDAIRAAARREGWGIATDDPAPGDRVPTLIRSPAWVRPIESLFQVIGILPGYNEVDVSASFLIFLSLFFAMIIGDAGYGLIFLALTLFARSRLRRAPPEPFRLLTVFSVATIVWGAICGAYFGMSNLPVPKVQWLGRNENVMHLCLFLGTIHLSVAHVWNMLRMLNSTQAIAQAGWTTVVWSMFFGARTLLLGFPFPLWYAPVGVLGLAAVLVFMTPWNKLKTEWVNHVMLPLTLMSNFGDVLSYLRLFALSVAGLQLAAAFNSMAGSVGFGNPLTGLVAALILFIGHALNIALGAVSVLVHGVRLNALEFSMHFGLEWSGIRYEPFAKARAAGEGQAR